MKWDLFFLLSPLERAKERDCIFYELITRMYQIIISAIDDCQNSSADDQSTSDNYLKFNIVIFIVEIFTSWKIRVSKVDYWMTW